MQTCAHYGVDTMRTDNPGVWRDEDRKIAALGVHLRRNVSSHGVGLNVTEEPLKWFGRIVACGLEGKGTTCLEREGGLVEGGVDEIAEVFVRFMAEELMDVDGVEEITESDVD